MLAGKRKLAKCEQRFFCKPLLVSCVLVGSLLNNESEDSAGDLVEVAECVSSMENGVMLSFTRQVVANGTDQK